MVDAASTLDETPTSNTLFGRISDGVRQLGVVRVVGIGTALTAALSIFVYAAISFTAPDYSVLYSGLTAADSGAIIKKLEAQNEPYTLRDDGTTILIDKANIPRIRIAIAEEKIISGGSIGYELLDRADPLSTTNSQFQVNRIRALEGELARTIGAINGVVSARVHLDVPTRDLFAEGEAAARASVVLKLQGDRRLQPRSVEAIQQVVASAVKNLAPERVAIIDAQGNLLARGDGNEQSTASTALFERKAEYERRYRDSVERLLTQYIGPNRVRADVTVDLDLAQVKRTSETFDPKSRVERSIQTVEEGSNRNDSRATKDASVRQNLPEGQQAPGNGQNSQEANNRTEETTNFEVSRNQTQETIEPGTVRRVSVAVMVDGKRGTDANGAKTYDDRSEEELKQLERLVRSVIGYDEKRGDQIEVVSLRFVALDAPDELPPGVLDFTKDDIVKMAQMGFLALAAAVIFFFGARPILRILVPANNVNVEELIATEGLSTLPAVIDEVDEVANLKAEIEREMKELETKRSAQLADMIDIDKIEGQVQASTVRRITEIFDKHPEEGVQVIRNWLAQRGG